VGRKNETPIKTLHQKKKPLPDAKAVYLRENEDDSLKRGK